MEIRRWVTFDRICSCPPWHISLWNIMKHCFVLPCWQFITVWETCYTSVEAHCAQAEHTWWMHSCNMQQTCPEFQNLMLPSSHTSELHICSIKSGSCAMHDLASCKPQAFGLRSPAPGHAIVWKSRTWSFQKMGLISLPWWGREKKHQQKPRTAWSIQWRPTLI